MGRQPETCRTVRQIPIPIPGIDVIFRDGRKSNHDLIWFKSNLIWFDLIDISEGGDLIWLIFLRGGIWFDGMFPRGWFDLIGVDFWPIPIPMYVRVSSTFAPKARRANDVAATSRTGSPASTCVLRRSIILRYSVQSPNKSRQMIYDDAFPKHFCETATSWTGSPASTCVLRRSIVWRYSLK